MLSAASVTVNNVALNFKKQVKVCANKPWEWLKPEPVKFNSTRSSFMDFVRHSCKLAKEFKYPINYPTTCNFVAFPMSHKKEQKKWFWIKPLRPSAIVAIGGAWLLFALDSKTHKRNCEWILKSIICCLENHGDWSCGAEAGNQKSFIRHAASFLEHVRDARDRISYGGFYSSNDPCWA